MSGRIEGVLVIVVMLAMSFVFQIQLKLYVGELVAILSRPGIDSSHQVRLVALSIVAWRPVFIGIMAVCLLGSWLFVLSRLELSLALPLASAGFVVNALGSGFLLGEHMSWERVVGTIVVATGLLLVLRT